MNRTIVTLNRRTSNRIFLFVVISALLFTFSGGVGAPSGYARAATLQHIVPTGTSDTSRSTMSAPTTPLGNVLNPDGTLNLNTGFSGSLDARGWQLASDPGMPPRFVADPAGAGKGTGGASQLSKGAQPMPMAPGDENWDGRFGTSGLSNYVTAVAVSGADDVYIGGSFTTAGGSAANYIVKWNRNGWTPLGSGTNSTVSAIAVSSTGDVYAGGNFTVVGGVAANRIAKWNGTSWSALSSGVSLAVYAIAVSSTGDVYIGGQFGAAGGVSALRIAKWNGSTWSALGSGVNGAVRAIAVSSTGDVYAGGGFTVAGGVTAYSIAKWDGTSWSAIGGSSNTSIYAIAVSNSGDVYVGGYITTVGGVAVSNIAKWDGTSWSALGTGMDNSVYAVAVSSTGDVYAGGSFTIAGGMAANRIAKWNGSTWSPLGTGMSSTVTGLAITSNGDLYTGGYFTTAGGLAASYMARWDGSAWSPLGSGVNSLYPAIYAMAISGVTGDVYMAGQFTTVGGVSANNIAKWNGSTWSPLGSGISDNILTVGVYALAVSGNGDVYAGGSFNMAGDVNVNNIAKWNGSGWSALGTGTGSPLFRFSCKQHR